MDNVDDIYPLTATQAGILYHTLRDPDPALYFEQVRTDISGDLDVERLRSAWQEVAERHSALRTIFVWEGLDDPLQIVRSTVDLVWRDVDLRHLDASELDDALDELCAVERQAGISLTAAPISRYLLVQTGDRCWHFVWNFHHIVLDGWSTVKVFDEAFGLYGGASPDAVVADQQVPAFRDHIVWLGAQDQADSETHWRELLAGFEAKTPLQFGAGRPATGFDLGRTTHSLDVGTSERIRTFARANRVTVNTLIQAAWSVVLSRYSGEDEVVFGVTISGRPSDLDGVENIVGMFLNTLPMRIRPPSSGTVSQWLSAVQMQQQDINTHQHSSLADVHRWSELAAGDSLFDSILIFENYPVGSLPSTEGITVERRAVFEQSHYPIAVMVGGTEELGFIVLFDQARFATNMIRQVLGHLENALISMVDKPDVAPTEVEILSAAEQHKIIEEWNDTDDDLGPDSTLAELFVAQARKTPTATALIHGDSAMSYSELDLRSNTVANYLRGAGVGPEVPVGISMFRSFEMVVGVLAIVKAGGTYVPLDPAYPRDRIALIANDADLGLVLTHKRAEASVPDCGATVIDIDEIDDRQWSNELAYLATDTDSSVLITFTSGSTGRPKGVQAHHRGIVNRIRWQWKHYPLGETEVTCQKTTLNFADHLWEFWGSLLSGNAQVLVPEDDVVDTPRFLELLARHRIERIVLVPSYIRALLDSHADLAARLPDLKYWTFSGEGVSRALADRFRAEMPHAVLLNFYGMSEVTLDATTYDDRWNIDCETVPIGRPIANQRVYLLDRAGRIAPPGVIATIHVSGVGLSRGYWARDDLTAERFRPHPFIDGATLYDTGDHGRWLPSGDVEYLGRSDTQVKIRGFRVEIGEVEANIRMHPGVRECVVTTDEHLGYTRLLAYLLADRALDERALDDRALADRALDDTEADVLTADVTGHVRLGLPGYMVPAAMMVLDEFPRTPNGKLDRLALPSPAERSFGQAGDVTPVSTTPDQRRMLELWSETLEIAVGLDDDFFEAGGHSLIALRLAARIAKEFEEELPLAAFFDAPTPRRLVAYLTESAAPREWTHMVPIGNGRDGRSNVFCIHGAGGNVLNFEPLGRHLDGEWSLVGVQASGVDGLRSLHRSIDEFCDAYIDEIVAYQPEGPYILAGYSAGGAIAYEIACRFVRHGREVTAVVLLDTFHPGITPAKLPTLRRAVSIVGSGPRYVKDRLEEEITRRRAVRNIDLSGRDGQTFESTKLDKRGDHIRLNTVAAMAAFTPSAYSGNVILFGARRINWAFERVGELRGWKGVAENLEYHEIPGRHPDLILGSNGAELATIMSARLIELSRDG